VLPFANTSGSPDSDYLSDGITDSLINFFNSLRDDPRWAELERRIATAGRPE
jgi:hypothetical protein